MKFSNIISRQKLWALVLTLLTSSLIFAPSISVAQQITNVGSQRDKQIIVKTDLISFSVSVTDTNGRAVSGLDKGVFAVYDNKQLQEISFFSDDDTPASVSIVFDTSSSMSSKKITQAKEALAEFIKTSKEQDEFFLIDFNDRPELLLNRTRDSDAVLNKLTYVEPQGNTALYDAVYLGLERVLRGIHPKKIVLIISDGEDNNSRFTYEELRQRLRESEAIIYAVGVGGLSPVKGRLNGRDTLDELAKVSGGKAFFPKGTIEMSEVFEKIALEIRHLYSIGYYPSGFVADSSKHRLKVKLTVPKGPSRLIVRSREVYYAGFNP